MDLATILNDIRSEYTNAPIEEQVKLSKYILASRCKTIIDMLALIDIIHLTSEDIGKIRNALSETEDRMVDIVNNTSVNGDKKWWILGFTETKDSDPEHLFRIYGTESEIKNYLYEEVLLNDQEGANYQGGTSCVADIWKDGLELRATSAFSDNIIEYFAIPETAIVPLGTFNNCSPEDEKRMEGVI